MFQELVEPRIEALQHAPAEEILAWVEQRFGESAAIASSFGAEDVVLIDLARRYAPSVKLFTLDTGRLPPETYEVAEAVRNRYGVALETYFPDREEVEKLTAEKGQFSFRRGLAERRECCAIRKVEPLRRALAGRQAWLTGLRREQAVTRTDVRAIEQDREHGLLKVSPLVGWSSPEIWRNGVPFNELHERGYPSVGCAPCTRAVKPWEDERAGRWWWEAAEHKECGLHTRRRA
jgi:phosphoadenosine phosphosulfate reductase